MNKIAPAFVAAKKAFGPALKDKTNPGFKSKYADLGACLEAVEKGLEDNNIVVYHESFLDESGITVECILLHESGEMIRGGKLHVPAVKHDPQGFGSAMTYARRYSLMAVCGIAPEDDDGNAAAKAKNEERAKQRARWLADQCAAIDAAASVGEMKATLADAITIAQGEKDDEAIATLNAAAATKIAKAKKVTA